MADPPAFAAVLDNTNPAVIIGHSGLVAQVNSSGGDGAYTYALQPADGNLTVGADGALVCLTAQITPTTLTAVATADDGHPNTPAVALSLTLRV